MKNYVSEVVRLEGVACSLEVNRAGRYVVLTHSTALVYIMEYSLTLYIALFYD
jgi:hypothetical protein